MMWTSQADPPRIAAMVVAAMLGVAVAASACAWTGPGMARAAATPSATPLPARSMFEGAYPLLDTADEGIAIGDGLYLSWADLGDFLGELAGRPLVLEGLGISFGEPTHGKISAPANPSAEYDVQGRELVLRNQPTDVYFYALGTGKGGFILVSGREGSLAALGGILAYLSTRPGTPTAAPSPCPP